ncbi:MAG: rRNA maturation RNase YbeY [Anaerolineae bacterium]
MPSENNYLGDLVIAYPYAAAQAQREGHALDDSLALLVVHGTLHLLGYDHDTPEHRAHMWAAQELALLALGISPEIVPALENRDFDDAQG